MRGWVDGWISGQEDRMDGRMDGGREGLGRIKQSVDGSAAPLTSIGVYFWILGAGQGFTRMAVMAVYILYPVGI